MSKSGLVRCDGVNRREAIRIGGLTALGLGIGSYFDIRAAQARVGVEKPSKAKSCILIWLDGGPSHLETFDPKPQMSSEVRGPLQTISTSLPLGLVPVGSMPASMKRPR